MLLRVICMVAFYRDAPRGFTGPRERPIAAGREAPPRCQEARLMLPFRTVRRSLLLVTVGALMCTPAVAVAAPPQVLLNDDFKHGLDLSSTWALLSLGSFTADDGVATAGPGGLKVTPPATNPLTGRPAFTKTAAGDFDHVKWMADTAHLSSNSVPGFDAVPGREVRCTMQGRGQTFGTAAQPFGSAVSDPQSDLRLASFAMNTIDFETGMVFDVWQTNTTIYPYYERLNLTGGPVGYEAFSSIFPGVRRTGDDKVTVAYDRAGGIVRWLVNGRVAARVDKIGFPSPQATTIIDHAGTPQLAAPRQLNCGMALFTLMDAGLPPSGEGLVDLGGGSSFPTSFAGGPTVYGQGAQLEVKRFLIRSVDRGAPDND
jgi:hypothetical protein